MTIALLGAISGVQLLTSVALVYNAGPQQVPIPPDATHAFVEGWGSGGQSAGLKAGAGGYCSALVPVIGGEMLSAWVGEPGSHGTPSTGALGGGLVGLFRASAPLLVAGSGGGAANGASSDIYDYNVANDGGGLSGNGGEGNDIQGGGGTQTSGGTTPGSYSGNSSAQFGGTPGSPLSGGAGYGNVAGNGGCGFYGGGGGGELNGYSAGPYGTPGIAYGGGGGGSSFNAAPGNSHAATISGAAGVSPMKSSPRFPAGATYGDADNPGFISILFFNGDPFAAGALSAPQS